MASIAKRKNGAYTILFYWDKPYQTKIHTPVKNRREAERIADKIQSVVNSRKTGTTNDETEFWLARLRDADVKMYQALAKIGLVEPPKRAHSVRNLVEEYLAQSTVSEDTKNKYRTAAETVYGIIGAETAVSSITVEMANRLVSDLRTKPLNRRSKVPQVYAPAQVNRLIVRVKTFFIFAEKIGWIVKSPFRFSKGGACVNPEKWQYVPKSDFQQVLDHTTNAKWKAIMVLGRYAGCRGASELHNLTWDRIDDENMFITFHATKKEGRDDVERTVPIHSEVLEILKSWHTKSGNDSPRVFPGMGKKDNLGTMIAKYIQHAGLDPWLEPWYNLRRSFCSDVMESGVEPKMYEEICGHSFATGMKHYQILHPERQRRGYDKVREVLKMV